MSTGWYKQAKISASIKKEADLSWKSLGLGAGLVAAPLAVGLLNSPPPQKPKNPTPIVSPQRELPSTKETFHAQEKNTTSPSTKELSAFIAPFEGKRSKAYKDSKGIPTIGIGHNLTKPGSKKAITDLGINYESVLNQKVSLTEQQIQILFNTDVQTAIKDANSWIRNLSSHPKKVQLVAIDMAFNMGGSTLSQFQNTGRLISQRQYASAAKSLEKSAWYRQVQPSRSHGHCDMLRELGDQPLQK